MTVRLSNNQQRKEARGLRRVGVLQRLMVAGTVGLFVVVFLRLQFSSQRVFATQKSLLELTLSGFTEDGKQVLPQEHQTENIPSDFLHSDSKSDEISFNKTYSSSTSSGSASTVFDMISIGSILRTSIQDAQHDTFGSHKSVRNFFRITEYNDTEAYCHTNLTMQHLGRILKHCKSRARDGRRPYDVLRRMTRHYANIAWLKKKANPTGWMCAQKRPVDGLMHVLNTYRQQQSNNLSLPDYLIIMDDDTWMNIDTLSRTLPQLYPVNQAYVVAGCMVRSRVAEHNFTFPFGGWGTILSRPAIENFLRPIYCQKNHTTMDDDEFTRFVCWRVTQNEIGEGVLFQEGMSVADLMYTYTMDQSYLNAHNWNDVGFCLHSDWNLGYFINYYNIPIHSGAEFFANYPVDRLRGYNGSYIYGGKKNMKNQALLRECLNLGEVCTPESAMCHYVSDDHMRKLHDQIQKAAPHR